MNSIRWWLVKQIAGGSFPVHVVGYLHSGDEARVYFGEFGPTVEED